jgi:hypothetical protein
VNIGKVVRKGIRVEPLELPKPLRREEPVVPVEPARKEEEVPAGK